MILSYVVEVDTSCGISVRALKYEIIIVLISVSHMTQLEHAIPRFRQIKSQYESKANSR